MKLHKHLEYMLSLKRPAWGKGWAATHDYIANAICEAGYDNISDNDGNLICTTKFTGVLFSCHLDTVHRSEGDVEVCMDDFGIITGWHQAPPVVKSGMSKEMGSKRERCVLGADDAAGAYIMLRMIEEGIHGTYVFHNSEEIGCLGSKALADTAFSINGYDLEKDFTHAIAFDRKGTSDFIYNQLGENMASREFSAELISRLSAKGLNYRREFGLVTDTAMYADYVQECINLSVGYYDEHTDKERLDYGHLELLLDTILSDPELFIGLPVARNIEDYLEYTDSAKYTFVPDSPAIKDGTVASLILKHPREVAEVLEGFFGVDYEELFNLLNTR